jgi:hypothetical protein
MIFAPLLARASISDFFGEKVPLEHTALPVAYLCKETLCKA